MELSCCVVVLLADLLIDLSAGSGVRTMSGGVNLAAVHYWGEERGTLHLAIKQRPISYGLTCYITVRQMMPWKLCHEHYVNNVSMELFFIVLYCFILVDKKDDFFYFAKYEINTN
jgi:hypothetical protein